QMPAYDNFTRLEFRRVLFRSDSRPGVKLWFTPACMSRRPCAVRLGLAASMLRSSRLNLPPPDHVVLLNQRSSPGTASKRVREERDRKSVVEGKSAVRHPRESG